MVSGSGIYEEQRVFNIEATAIDATASSQFVIAAGFHKAHIINTAAADSPIEVKIKNKLITFLSCHPKWSQSVAVVSGSDIGIYSLDTMRQEVKWKHANGSSRFVTDLCWSYFESNLLVTCSPYDSTLVRDVRNCRKIAVEIGAQSGASQSKFSPMLDHVLATTSCNQAILWDIRNPKRSMITVEAHQFPVTCLKWHPVQKHSFFTCSKNNILKCWDFFDENGEFSGNLDCHERDLEAWRFWFSPDGEEYAVINSPLNPKFEGQMEVYQYPFQENLNPLKIDNSDLFVDVCWSRHQTKPKKFVWALRQKKGLIRHAIVFDYSSENRESMSTPLAQSAMDEDADRLVGTVGPENVSPSSSEFGSPEKFGIIIGEMDIDQKLNFQKESNSWSENSSKFSPTGNNLSALVAQARLSRNNGGSVQSPVPPSPVVTDFERWITAPSMTGGDLWTEMDALWTIEADGITMTEINIPRAALGFTYEHNQNSKKLGFELRFHKNFIENGKLILKLLSKDCPLNPDQSKKILLSIQEESDRQVRIPSTVPVFTRVVKEIRKLIKNLNFFDDFEERKKSINSEDNESEGSEGSLRHSMSLSFVPSQLDEWVPAPRTSGAQFDSSGFLVRFGNFRKTEKNFQRSESKLSGLDFKALGIIDVVEAESESKQNPEISSDEEKNGIIFEMMKPMKNFNEDEFQNSKKFRMNKRERIRAFRRLQSSEDPELDGLEGFCQDSETTASEDSNENLTSDSSEEQKPTVSRRHSESFVSSDSSLEFINSENEEDSDFKIVEENPTSESESDDSDLAEIGRKKNSVLARAPKSSLFPFGDRFRTPRSLYDYLLMMEPILKDIAESKKLVLAQMEDSGNSFSPDLMPKGDSIPFHCVSPVRNYSISSSPTTASIWLHRNNPTGRLSSSPTSGRNHSSRHRGGSLTLTDPENNLKGSSSDALVSTPVELFDVSYFLAISKKMAKKYRFIGNSFTKMIKKNKKIAEEESRQDVAKTWEICEVYVRSCAKQKLFKNPIRCSDKLCPTILWDINAKYDPKQEIEKRKKMKESMMNTNRYQVSWNAGDVNAQFFANLLEGHIAQGDVQAIAAVTCTLGEPCKLPQKPRPRRSSTSAFDSPRIDVLEDRSPQDKPNRSTSEMNIIPSSPLINVIWPPYFNKTERSSSIGNSYPLDEYIITTARRQKLAKILGPLAERNTVHGSLMTVDPNENSEKKEEDNFQFLKKLASLKPRSNSVDVGDLGLFLAENFSNPIQTPSPPASETPTEDPEDQTFIFDYGSDADIPMLKVDLRRGTPSEPYISGMAIDQFESYRVQYASILARWGYFKKSAEVLKFCPSQQPQQFEQIIVCQNCQKILDQDQTDICKDCQIPAIICSICQLPCYGLIVTCPLCSHGGHSEHMLKWFKEQTVCPFGCGCSCPL